MNSQTKMNIQTCCMIQFHQQNDHFEKCLNQQFLYFLLLLLMFRRFIPIIKENHEQALKPIETFLYETASKISERAVLFIKSLKYVQMVTEDDLFNWRYDIKQPSISPICSKIMNENENYSAFRCYDCMESISSCICAECFQNGDHKGHNYVQYQAINGCCDCGSDQSWNKKGFCKSHGKSSEIKPQISPETQELYLKEFRLAFFIYFYLGEYKKVNVYKQKYGNALFGYLINLCQQNYQMKYLAYILLSSPLSTDYKSCDAEFQIPILHRLFTIKPSNQLNKFVQLTFEIFPVEEFRISMLTEYFSKMSNKKGVLTRDHPFGTLNFQFLSCVKLINRLILSQQLSPFQLYPHHLSSLSINMAQAFKKYYEDLDYIKNMRSAKQYHILHLERTNVCSLCFYRNYTVTSTNMQIEQLMQFNLDQIFLKTFGHFVKSILAEKALIQKCLKELIQYIYDAQINTISLAHQRAFAMLTFAYFNGNIYELLDKPTCTAFVKAIFIKGTTGLKKSVVNSLISKLYIFQRSSFETNHNAHQRYYLKLHPEQNFNQFLDISYHKIIMMVCRYHDDYSSIVESTLSKIGALIKLYEQKQQSSQKECKLIGIHQKLYNFLNFLNTVTQINIDEIVITNYIGLPNEKQIFYFYRRLLASFKIISIKDFKNLATSIINNSETLEKFVKQYCLIEKGKVKCKQQAQPLETYVYHQFFKKYQKKITEVEPCFLHSKLRLPYFENFVVFNPKTVQSIIEIAMNYLFKFSMNFSKQFSTQFSLICFQILKIYLEDNSSKEKSFFITLLQPSFRQIISKELLQQITIIQKKQQLQNQRGRIKDQKQVLDKKRKEKLLAKKKEKQIFLKINQSKFLDVYQSVAKLQEQQNTNNCIYCKQGKEEELNFISYIGLTNFYQQQLLQQNGYHVYFQSCGHKIHKSCFEVVMLRSKSNYCFLCKRQTNVLIPETSTSKAVEVDTTKSADIIASFHAVMINQREQIKSQVKASDQFLNSFQVNFYDLIVDGLCKDILYLGLHDYNNYMKTKYSIHYQLHLILKGIHTTQIKQIFQKIRPKLNHKLNFILEYIQFKFKQLLLGFMDQHSFKSITSQQIQQINSFFTLFSNPKGQSQYPTLSLFKNESLFIILAQNLSKMSSYMGECKICHHVTNYIYLCLKCEWSCCRKCLNLMYKHSTYYHMDGSIFISCTNGAVKYMHGGNIFEDGSIYENYLGQSYLEMTSQLQALKCQKFTLHTGKIEILQKMALEYGIHQKIFLNER